MLESKTKERINLPSAPKTVDFNVIGKCNLDCEWCWGPDHKTNHSLTAEHWIEIAKQLRRMGTENVILTGGEPTLRRDLVEIISNLKKIGLRVTLSTNAMLLLNERNKKLLDSIDEIGIPLDGATREMNNEMRRGDPKAFNDVIQALKYIQQNHPEIKVTLRTVLSRKNIDDVQSIPNTLSSQGIDLNGFRWKIYQITPTGPRTEQSLLKDEGWLVSEEETLRLVDYLKASHPNMTIGYLLSKEHDGRYLHIDPTGKITTLIGEDPKHVEVGSVFDENQHISLLEPMKHLEENYQITDRFHGTDNF